MTSIDDRIRHALSAEDEAFLKSLDEEPGLIRQAGDMFRGVMGRWTLIVYTTGFVATGVGAWAIVRMLEARETRELILWMSLAWACWTALLGIKIWVWLRLNSLLVLRELKRMELRASQAGR